MQETWVLSLGGEDALEEEMAAHFSILAWKIPWTEELGGPQSTGSQRVRQDLLTKQPQKGRRIERVFLTMFWPHLPLVGIWRQNITRASLCTQPE